MTLLRTYLEAARGFRRLMATSIALLTTAGLAEAAGLAALLPLLSSSLSPSAGGRSTWFGLSGDTLIVASIAALVGLGTLSALLRFFGETSAYTLSVSIERSLRRRMVEALLNMRWSAYVGAPLGDGVKSVMVESSQIGQGALQIVYGIGNASVAAVFVVVAAVIDPIMTGAVLLFGGMTAVIYQRVGRRAQDLATELSAESAVMAERVMDLLSNAKFYRSTGLRRFAEDQVGQTFARWAQRYARIQRYQPQARLGFEVSGIVFIGGVLVFSLVVLGDSLATSLVFLALFYRLAPRLQVAQQALLQARSYSAWWGTWKDQYEAALTAAEVPHGGHAFDEVPRIEFDSVGVTYPARTVPALTEVSFAIAPGECVAVVGESGGGKTTLLDLVTGLVEPNAGMLRLDGVPLSAVDLEAWRSHIGVVMQDSPVFLGSVLENVAWGDHEPDLERVRQVIEMADLTALIDTLPDGLETEVGQKGGRLSGGQRQRLGLARALYRDPWLLILDEATSALDSRSEQVIQDALGSLRGSCSLFVVAHRLKTVQIADRIIVLSRGRVVQMGTWDELVHTEGHFLQLATAQGIRGKAANAPRS